MKREILTIAALLWTGSATAADSGHCDSKPFTLKKPVADKPAPAPAPAVTPKSATPKPTPPKTAHANKSKYVIGCKQPKS